MNPGALKHFPARLKALRNAANYSQEELAHKSKLDRTYISMLERGMRNPTLGTLEQLSEALKVGIWEFIGGKPHASSSDSKNIQLPLYGTPVSCGQPFASESNVEKELSLDELLIKRPEKTFFVRAMGDSMEPTISSGDVLVIEKNTKIKPGEIGVFRIESEFTTKRFVMNGKKAQLKPDNPAFQSIIFSENEIEVCGIVKSVVKILSSNI